MKVLAVLVNYGDEQISYLQKVVTELKKFEKYQVDVTVNSNIPLSLNGIDKVNIFTLDDYQLLPLTCRKTIWENKDKYDVFIFSENDHLFLERHIDKHLEYEKILPANMISGLIQYEQAGDDYYYPAYHSHFEWDFKSAKTYGGKKFAHFKNLHQASFILTKAQLLRIGRKINFNELTDDKDKWMLTKWKNFQVKLFNKKFPPKYVYSTKCKVNTDVYMYGGLKKMICISEFEDNLIHHLPNLYINGDKGRYKKRSDQKRMQGALEKFLK